MNENESSERHNAAIVPLMRMLIAAAPDEAGQWVLLETLCLGVGQLNGRTPREAAIFVETMAERLVSGERG